MENLLSKNYKESLRRSYRKRLLIVLCWLVVASVPIFLVLAAPAYIAAGIKFSEIKDRNEVNEMSQSEETDIFALPEVVDRKAEAILAHKSIESAHKIVSSALSAAPSGIEVNHVIFERSKNKQADTMKVSGIARDREALTVYQQSIKKLSFVGDAMVPVESFSRPTNLSFLVNVSLASSSANVKQ